jgi:hypothetical protein
MKGKEIMMRKKTMKKGLSTAVFTVYTAFCCMLLFGMNGQAYIDPSVMTYMIQAVAGIVIAIGAVVGIYWRRTRNKIRNKLGMDENQGKEVESDEIKVKQDKL